MKCDVPTTACISENDDDAEGAMAIDVDNGKIGSAGLEFEKKRNSQAVASTPHDADRRRCSSSTYTSSGRVSMVHGYLCVSLDNI